MKKGADGIQGVSSGEVACVWVGTGAKVAPQQVSNYICCGFYHVMCH